MASPRHVRRQRKQERAKRQNRCFTGGGLETVTVVTGRSGRRRFKFLKLDMELQI